MLSVAKCHWDVGRKRQKGGVTINTHENSSKNVKLFGIWRTRLFDISSVCRIGERPSGSRLQSLTGTTLAKDTGYLHVIKSKRHFFLPPFFWSSGNIWCSRDSIILPELLPSCGLCSIPFFCVFLYYARWSVLDLIARSSFLHKS